MAEYRKGHVYRLMLTGGHEVVGEYTGKCTVEAGQDSDAEIRWARKFELVTRPAVDPSNVPHTIDGSLDRMVRVRQTEIVADHHLGPRRDDGNGGDA